MEEAKCKLIRKEVMVSYLAAAESVRRETHLHSPNYSSNESKHGCIQHLHKYERPPPLKARALGLLCLDAYMSI